MNENETCTQLIESALQAAGWSCERLLVQFGCDLSHRLGRGFSKSNLFQRPSFHLAYRGIIQTPSGKSAVGKSVTEKGQVTFRGIASDHSLGTIEHFDLDGGGQRVSSSRVPLRAAPEGWLS